MVNLNILGVADSHCSTASLIRDGKVVGAVSEERFTRMKNHACLPTISIKTLLDDNSLSPDDLDLVVLATDYHPAAPPVSMASGKSGRTVQKLTKNIQGMRRLASFNKGLYYAMRQNRASRGMFHERVRTHRIRRLSDFLGIDSDRIVVLDHHLAHAYSALFSSPFSRSPEALVFTMDGSGDFVSSTVSIWRNNTLNRVATTKDADSLGLIWTQITQLLGMKPVEHEYKVMGLAPYAPIEGTEKALQRIRPLITLNNDLTFRTSFATMWEVNHFESTGLLQGLRFDHIAAGLQKLTEELLTRWVADAIERYGVRTVVFGGGVFMNVKANMKIAQMPEVENAFFMPSCGDESLAIGAGQYGYYRVSGQIPNPLEDLYLGPAYSADQIEEELEAEPENLQWESYNDIDGAVSELLAKGEIVARFDGRMEWGARALGNRSILADPSDWDVVKKINIAIKQRDFWMPFAPTILTESAPDYVSSPSPSKVNGEYMIVAFESTEKVPSTMKAAMHPYDLTIRPQLLRKEHNPRYYRLIERFSELKGKSGILNTSFNLHGEPVVCSPTDALSTFRRSGLDYLAIGSYLVTKGK